MSWRNGMSCRAGHNCVWNIPLLFWPSHAGGDTCLGASTKHEVYTTTDASASMTDSVFLVQFTLQCKNNAKVRNLKYIDLSQISRLKIMLSDTKMLSLKNCQKKNSKAQHYKSPLCKITFWCFCWRLLAHKQCSNWREDKWFSHGQPGYNFCLSVLFFFFLSVLKIYMYKGELWLQIYGCPSDNCINIFGFPATFLVVLQLFWLSRAHEQLKILNAA